MAHGAMAGTDPMTESSFNQLEAPAAEGAWPPLPYSAARLRDSTTASTTTSTTASMAARAAALADAQRDPALRWLLPLGVVGGVVAAWLRYGGGA